MKHYLIILLMMFVFHTVTAGMSLSGDSTFNYFPLSIGNSWTYSDPLDTTHQWTKYINDSCRVNGLLYFIMSYAWEPSYAETLRVDANGNVRRYAYNNEFLHYDFSPDSGTKNIIYASVDDTLFVYVSKNISFDGHAGHFINCIELFYNHTSMIDDEIGYTFAPGVGMIREYGAWSYGELFTAIIDGKVITSTNELTAMPTQIKLQQNYPNPFNPVTIINYELPRMSKVVLKIYDILGQELETLVNNFQEAGNHQSVWNADGLSGGVYFYVLRTENFIATKKLVFIK